MVASHTLSTPFTLEGTGIHTGATTRVTVTPASHPCGYVFVRNGVRIPALADYVTDTRRSTTLGRSGQTIGTVEHLLAALYLSAVDHVVIEVDGPELPALDGSARQWHAAICAAGVCPLQAEKITLSISRARWVKEGQDEFFLLPADSLQVYAALSMPDTVADAMLTGGTVSDSSVREQILRARTFGLEREVQALLEAGLAQGGSLENAVILTRTGYLNPRVYPEEPAWHKVLDLVGDLALVGARLSGQVLAVRCGHRTHVALAARLRADYLGGAGTV